MYDPNEGVSGSLQNHDIDPLLKYLTQEPHKEKSNFFDKSVINENCVHFKLSVEPRFLTCIPKNLYAFISRMKIQAAYVCFSEIKMSTRTYMA